MSTTEPELDDLPESSDNIPNDNTTLTEVIDGYVASGAEGHFTPMAGAMIECASCGSSLDAGRFPMLSLRRMEGASDPDDLLSVMMTRCPVCGTEGTLVLGYGPTATAEDQDIQMAITDRRDDPAQAGDASPSDLPDN
jgi:hypothetical protein